MSTDERILRLENALTTLAELSADHERRVTRIEEAFVTLVTLVRSYDERMDRVEEGMDELRAAQTNSEQKIAALADAHIRTEDALASLAVKVNEIINNRPNGDQAAH